MLTGDDPLALRPSRVVVAGTSGVGKTTLALRLAARLELPHTEIDALHHGPGWQPRPEFLDDVQRLVAMDRWVTEWNYTVARPLLAARADLLVWLDLPYRVTFQRVVRRTVRRRIRREVLWNGNVEPPLRTMLTDPEHVIRWSVRTRHKTARLLSEVEQEHPRLVLVRLRNAREVERWTTRLGHALT